MTPPNRGGFADYDDPDFDSEWFDDEAYDRALEGGYEEEPPARGAAGAEGRQPATSASQTLPTGRPRAAAGMRGALVPTLLTLTAVVLAVGAGFYVVVRAADSGVGGPLAEAGRRVQAALAVLRGEPVSVEPVPPGQPVASAEPSPSGDEEATATAPGQGVEPVASASGPMVAAVASAAGPGPAPMASRVGPASAPIAAQPTPAKPTDVPGRPPGPGASPVVPPPTPAATATPRLPAAVPSAKAARPTPFRSAPVASPVPTAAPTRPSPAKAPVPTPTPRPARQPVAPPTATPAPARPGAAHTSLLFEPNVVVPSGAQVEQLWRFTSALGARPGTLLVTARVGFGRFAPALAQRRGTEVATLLRRNTAGAAWRVELRVDRQVTRGIAGRQVDVDFVPTP